MSTNQHRTSMPNWTSGWHLIHLFYSSTKSEMSHVFFMLAREYFILLGYADSLSLPLMYAQVSSTEGGEKCTREGNGHERWEADLCTRVEEDWLIAMGQPADDGGRAIGSRGNFYRDDTRTYMKMNFFSFYFSLSLSLSTPEEKRENRFLLTGKAIDQLLQKFFVVREIKRNVYKRKCEIVASSTVRMRSVWWIHSADESIYKPFGGENVYNSGRNDGHREPNESNEKVSASQTTERMAAFIHSAKCLLLPYPF